MDQTRPDEEQQTPDVHQDTDSPASMTEQTAEPVVEDPSTEEPAAIAEPEVPEELAPSEDAAVEESVAVSADVAEAPEGAPAAEAPPAEADVSAEAARVEDPGAPVEQAGDEDTAEPAGGEGTEEEDTGVSLLDDWQPGEWFVVHTYAGYENKVKANLETRIATMNMEDRIYEVVIPMEDVVQVKGGKKQVVQQKVFPGYLMVRMDLDDDSWYVVRNTPGVTGFVGSGTKPIPLSESEVEQILRRGEAAEEERPRARPEWQVNDPVRVTTGPFANFQGVVSEIDLDRSKLKVLVNIFGRETPVELGFDQVSKV